MAVNFPDSAIFDTRAEMDHRVDHGDIVNQHAAGSDPYVFEHAFDYARQV